MKKPQAGLTSGTTWWRAPEGRSARLKEVITAELCDTLFGSLSRRDQREKGEQYLRALLEAQGRKSIRNLATHLGGAAAEQRLQHFISNAPWDWMPVRDALASYLERKNLPQAYVVRALSIPKAGNQSVGVNQGFDPHLGRIFRGQRAFGMWHASPALSVPVNWRMFLPDTCFDQEPAGRSDAAPTENPKETLEECAVKSVLETLPLRGVPLAPVVLDLPMGRVDAAFRRFADAGVPAVARVRPTTRLTVEDPALAGFSGGPLQARQIAMSARSLRRPVTWADPATPNASHHSLVATVQVRELGRPAGPRNPADGRLLLLAEWQDPQRVPENLWVANAHMLRAEALLLVTKLTSRVDLDVTQVGFNTGLRDFEGRSLRGWHRHMSLASAAHAIEILSSTEGRRTAQRTHRQVSRLSA
ncbi:putative ISXo8 transposase [Streptomyces inusitatus]|uniref:ISXo8 transposase n=1 Tax=Streptomyces inusitatus TaxID=68221 RepID=A0A918V463_9ACTN|nr:transposase [Streptomyces inusitatus]GGZ62125.1 putative ISXo8 transposase [Streptomyces inusitatus]